MIRNKFLCNKDRMVVVPHIHIQNDSSFEFYLDDVYKARLIRKKTMIFVHRVILNPIHEHRMKLNT